MPTAKALYLLSVLTCITFIPVVHCYNNNLLKMITEIEDLRIFTTDLKYGHRRFVDQTETFIEKIRSIKFLARYLEVGVPSTRWFLEEQRRLSEGLRYKMPPSGNYAPQNRLYTSAALERLDHFRRIFLYNFARTGVYYRGAESKCHMLKLHANANLQGQTITVSHVCTSLHSCANVPKPYEIPQESSGSGSDSNSGSNSQRDDEDLTRACTADNKCNVEKALPFMTGLFYSKVYEVASHFECCRMLSTENECESYARSLQEVKREADVLLAYAYSHPEFWNTHWSNFFIDAISSNAHLDIGVAVSLMEEKRYDFEILRVACKTLQFAEACIYEDIYKQYLIIEKSQQNRNNPTYVKDLRLHQHIDHAKLVELQKIKLQHIEILGSIRDLDENLEASISGISTYLGELAAYDQGIADADAAFISGELQKYTTTLSDVQEKLETDLHEAMSYMMAVQGARLGEKVGELALSIATNANPLRAIFTGPDLTEIASLANDVADAGANVAKAVALIASLTELADDSEKFADAFIGNSEQLSTVQNLKDQILDGQANNLNEDADKFLEQYSAYTPQTDRSSLARNDALWSAFKDATCDLLFTDTGVLSAIPKGIAGAKLLCERLEGTLAQYFTLREDIFEFQFQMIDAMAGIVRGNLAGRLAANIRGNGIMSGAELLTTFFLAQSDLQTVASTYCDVIEYKQLGQPFSGCATFHGLFRKENLDALITYKPSKVTYHEVERFVTIPTQPSYPGDTAYIDLNALARGNDVLFQLPKNRTWLDDNRWTVSGQRNTEVPFVKEFEIYLPHKSYESGSIPSSSAMEITIKSIAGSFVSTLNPNTGTVYILPRASGTYLSSYEENYSSCSKEIKNPYSLCENLRKLCVLMSRHPGQDALLPTILSTWSVNLRRTQGSRTLTWEAPHPSTNLSLSAKLSLKAPSLRKKKRSSLKHAVRSDVVNSENGCCESNRYRVNRMVNQQCATCPVGSTALLRGLYCEIDQPPESHAKRIIHHQKRHHQSGKSSPRHVG